LVPYRQTILEYLNLVFGNSMCSDSYWSSSFVETVETLYDDAFSHERSQNTLGQLKQAVDFHALFDSVRRLTGMVFSPHCVSTSSEFFDMPTPFQDTDLLSFPPKIKEMRIAAYASATALYLKAKYNTNDIEAKRLISIASLQFESALKSSPDDDMILCNYALLLRLQKRNEEATTYYKMAIHSNPQNVRILSHYAWFLHHDLGQYDKAERYYKKIFELDPNHPRTLSDYATFLWASRKDFVKAEEYYKKGIEMGDKQAFAAYANFLSQQGRLEESRYYEEHLKSAPGTSIMNGKYNDAILF